MRAEGHIVGNYLLRSVIGRGGMSEVYAAEHRFLGEPVAVKLLRWELARDDAAIESFVSEAAKTRAVDHPNVVRLIDFGRDDATACCYLVMERVDGENLAARLRRVGRLAEPDVRRLGAAIADGMHAAHERGIVHRDLKPANVMLRGDQPKIVDFGIAKSLGNQSAVTTSRRIGTPAYMAPEQLTGGLIAPCVDIWALGAILFESATGRLPFESFADGRCPQLFETPPRASSLAPLSSALDDLIARCLARDPGLRPASMSHVARALREAWDVEVERITQDIGAPASPAWSAQPPTGSPSWISQPPAGAPQWSPQLPAEVPPWASMNSPISGGAASGMNSPISGGAASGMNSPISGGGAASGMNSPISGGAASGMNSPISGGAASGLKASSQRPSRRVGAVWLLVAGVGIAAAAFSIGMVASSSTRGRGSSASDADVRLVAMSGSSDAPGATSGKADAAPLSGRSDPGAMSGKPDAGSMSGTSDMGSTSGNSDAGAKSGTSDMEARSGNADARSMSGTSDAARVSGSADAGAPMSGKSDTGAMSGSSDTGAMSGSSDTGAMSGRSDAARVSGSAGAGAPMSGDSGVARVSGGSDAVPSGGTDGAAKREGRSDARLQVEVRSSPSGAQIVVDGKRRGVTPARLALAEGSAIVVRRAGYRPSTVRATRAGAIDVRLVPVRRPGVRPASTGGETLD